MTTVTIKINEKKKAGKTLLELIDFFRVKEKNVVEVVEDESPYNPEFVKKIKEAEKRADFIEVDPKNIWESLGLK